MYDLIIVGAGPAGLTASIYAGRANKTSLILDKGAFGGQITSSPKVENYPGFESISGNELADKMLGQAMALGADVEIENVTGIKDLGKTKQVITEDGNTYESKAVIIACGVKHRHLGLDNEERFIGDGISFCAVCDGAFYKDKTVILIGGGNSALQEAIFLSETCKKLYIVQNLDFLTGEQRLQEVLTAKKNVEIITGSVVDSINDTDVFSGITVKNTKTGEKTDIKADGMFVAIGLLPDNKAFENVVKLDKAGYIDIDESCTSDTKGIFVAGDCRNKKIRQVTTASSDGAVATIAACSYIDKM